MIEPKQNNNHINIQYINVIPIGYISTCPHNGEHEIVLLMYFKGVKRTYTNCSTS